MLADRKKLVGPDDRNCAHITPEGHIIVVGVKDPDEPEPDHWHVPAPAYCHDWDDYETMQIERWKFAYGPNPPDLTYKQWCKYWTIPACLCRLRTWHGR